MQPDLVGHNIEAVAVVSALFLLITILCVANLVVSKFKLFAILAFSSVLRGVGYACAAANLVQQRRDVYIVYQVFESVGYGASIVVLFVAVALWLRVPKEERPPHRIPLALVCHILPVLTGALALVVAPLAFTKMYQTDMFSENQLGRKLALATFWGRAAILAIFACMIVVLAGYASKSYSEDEKVQKNENAIKFLAAKSPAGAADKWIHHDTRLLIHVIMASTLLQCIPCAFQVTSLYYEWFERDVYYIPLVVLPQLLEVLILNIPGLLPRLAKRPPDRSESTNGSTTDGSTTDGSTNEV